VRLDDDAAVCATVTAVALTRPTVDVHAAARPRSRSIVRRAVAGPTQPSAAVRPGSRCRAHRLPDTPPPPVTRHAMEPAPTCATLADVAAHDESAAQIDGLCAAERPAGTTGGTPRPLSLWTGGSSGSRCVTPEMIRISGVGQAA
jgi:hypothetical protein